MSEEEHKQIASEAKLKEFKHLNDELLEPPKPESTEVKRNTKDALIDRILAVAEQNDMELTFSNTKLKRMSKDKLGKLLGELTAEVVKRDMARAVGSKGTSEKAIGIATLRMCHDMLAMATENGLNQCLPKYGYQVEGFCSSLQHPTVSKCVDECLEEIAATSDVLQYIESPYARLAIAWGGALASTVRPLCNQQNLPRYQRNVRPTNMESTAPNRAQTVQHRPGRRPQARQEHRPARPTTPNVQRI